MKSDYILIRDKVGRDVNRFTPILAENGSRKDWKIFEQTQLALNRKFSESLKLPAP